MIRTLVVLVALSASRLNWLGFQSDWRASTGWNRLPRELRADLTSDRLPDLRPGWPVLLWLGHAGFLVEWNGTRLLLDPNDAEWVNVCRRNMTHPAPPSTWGRIDAAIISHGHQDHLVKGTLAAVAELGAIIVPAGSEEYVAGVRGAATRILGARLHEPIRIGEVDIIAVPAAHNGNRNHPWASEKKAFGYILRSRGETVYFAGDTGFANDFAGIRDRYHPSLALLPIGAFAPRVPLKIHHLDPAEAVAAAKLLGVSRVVPCHFGTFTLTLDYPSTALPRFARLARKSGVSWVMPGFLAAPPSSGTGNLP